jgi:hypothetical protein
MWDALVKIGMFSVGWIFVLIGEHLLFWFQLIKTKPKSNFKLKNLTEIENEWIFFKNQIQNWFFNFICVE